MNAIRQFKAVRVFAILVIAASLAAGCASPDKAVTPIYFPPPPSEPRLQFLRSYNKHSDIIRLNPFVTFLIGTRPHKIDFVKLYGVAVAKDKLYFADTITGMISITDFVNGKVDIHQRQRGAGYRKPVNLAVDRDGALYIADTTAKSVFILNPDGTAIDIMGASHGIKNPTGVAVTDDRIYVCDRDAKDIKVFDKATREILFTIPDEKDGAKAAFSKPVNIAVDKNNNLYVVDTFRFRVQKYDSDGKYLMAIGRHGDSPGEFGRPRGIAVDRESRIYVADGNSEVVQIFNDKGELLMFFGEGGSGKASLVLPAQIAIDYDNVDLFREYAADDFELEHLVWVTCQYGGRKICLYGFGHKK